MVLKIRNVLSFHSYSNWWRRINWSTVKLLIEREQEKIYITSKQGNQKKVNKLMKNMVRMECSKIYAIYLITQKNKGRYSAGIDGKTYLSPIERYELSENPFDFRTYIFQPVKIVHIPKKKRYSRKFRKKNRKRRLKLRRRNVEKKNTRPIGIMTIKDRVMAKIISFALSAKWEALFESNVMGYRPKRSVEDAIFKICEELFKGHRVILDADIKQFFDMISHRAILDKITVFHDIIERILKIPILRNGLTLEY